MTSIRTCGVPERLTFRMDAMLKNAQGQLLSTNHHIMILGNQEHARKRCQEKAAQWQALKREFPTADYYRLFPELSGRLTIQKTPG